MLSALGVRRSESDFEVRAFADPAGQARKETREAETPAVFSGQGGDRALDDYRIFDRARTTVGRFAANVAKHIAGSEPDTIDHAQTFHFGGPAVGDRIQVAVDRRDPDRRGHTEAVAAKGHQADVLLGC